MTRSRDIRTLLRLIFGSAAGAIARRIEARRRTSGAGWRGEARQEDAAERAASTAVRCRLALDRARAERARLAADLLRYGKAREVLVAREAAEPEGPGRDGVRHSLDSLDKQLLAWLDEHDALVAQIAELESDLAFLEDLIGAGERPPGGDPEAAVTGEAMRHLAALGLYAFPGTMTELKAAYRARLKVVHPDVGTQPSTEAAAAATVAFAELRTVLTASERRSRAE